MNIVSALPIQIHSHEIHFLQIACPALAPTIGTYAAMLIEHVLHPIVVVGASDKILFHVSESRTQLVEAELLPHEFGGISCCNPCFALHNIPECGEGLQVLFKENGVVKSTAQEPLCKH